jgi:chorismate mutase/GNAT superfamily N-acetyltransferase
MSTEQTQPQVAPDLLLRSGGPEDADALAVLATAARQAAVPAMPPPVHTPEEDRAWIARQLAGERDVWLAERDGELVGYILLEPGWLHSIYVRPGLSGQGIGTALLDLAKALRPDGFALWVFESNAPARRFYLRHGLVELERTDGSTNEEGAPDLRMAWPGPEPLAYLRGQVDEVDAELARVLARRAALTAAIQAHKAVPGQAGRDARREAEIVDRMAAHVPGLGRERLAQIMDAVISASLAAADDRD